MKKVISDFEEIPPFYGIAYRDYLRRDIYICYPLGVNLIVMLWRDVMTFLKNPKEGGH